MERAVLLLSAGLDSTVNAFCAAKELNIVRALTIDYGQRASIKEIEQSKKICEQLSIPHQVIPLTWYKDLLRSEGKSSLVNEKQELPQGEGVDIHSLEQSQKTAESVWVPNRNGLFLNVAASFAESLDAKYIIVGFNKEEAETFADNSKEYLFSLNKGFTYSTANSVEVKCYTIDKVKKEIAQMAKDMSIDFNLMWPCYSSGVELCGECESCKRFIAAKKGLQ